MGIEKITGGLEHIAGLSCAGVHGGFRKNPERLDFALIYLDQGAKASATFTRNVFCAAPVQLSRAHLLQSQGRVRAIAINSGNANAATGATGLAVAEHSAAIAAQVLDCAEEEVLVASTGVIGQQLDAALFDHSLPLAKAALAEGSAAAAAAAAEAIMTTDTHPKYAAYDCGGFKVAGMAKGSGMIQPDMATMLAVVATDAAVAPSDLQIAFKSAVADSFNRVTIDSDTSTNDSAFCLATGKARSANQAELTAALLMLCQDLALQIARDGEGATKLITVKLKGAASAADADLAARAVANSPLVKTAVYGHDANWGRIAMAVGKSGALFKQEAVNIDIMGIPVCRRGLAVDFDEEQALGLFEHNDEIVLDIDLGAGDQSATIWSCDLSHDYIKINADYRT
ncbi:MAG: bifunctional glutamate N-acetyltransferase/amino-acid acetyltransferase ArgJ [Coriobacteriales bacterium]|nr:bifunctional glutamate N-acetyltransferase/amino-acid acetyltransferase ArgJ [Coriobacteriales bacterium]